MRISTGIRQPARMFRMTCVVRPITVLPDREDSLSAGSSVKSCSTVSGGRGVADWPSESGRRLRRGRG